jgi:hypothetical protein
MLVVICKIFSFQKYLEILRDYCAKEKLENYMSFRSIVAINITKLYSSGKNIKQFSKKMELLLII